MSDIIDDENSQLHAGAAAAGGPAPSANGQPLLSRLSQYFLACLSQDGEGVSVPSQTKSNSPDYVELSQLPETSDDLAAQKGVTEITGKFRQDKSRLTLYLGYPTVVQPEANPRIAPLILFQVDWVNGRPHLDLAAPILNQRALASLTGMDREGLIHELVALESELGIGSGTAAPPMAEMIARLQALRPDWSWVESCAPETLSSVPALSKIRKAGVYNRAVLLITERSLFTRGLEAELLALSQMSSERTDETALGRWLWMSDEPSADPVTDGPELIEVLPMNTEQRQAVASALTQPLTVITGPPGTGKSQVVANILVNCAWHGKKVLFASKNNKAVDVVEARVNALGSRPVMLRVGANDYQMRLSDYLTALLGAAVSTTDLEVFAEARAVRDSFLENLEELDRQAAALVALRNRVDRLERAAERIRAQRGVDWFLNTWYLAPEDTEAAVSYMESALDASDRARHGLLTRLAWQFKRHKYFGELRDAIQAITRLDAWLGVEPPTEPPTDANLPGWRAAAAELRGRLTEALEVLAYLRGLANLLDSKSLEEISAERVGILQDMPATSRALWEAWVRLQPSRLTPTDRTTLTRYSTSLRMALDSGGRASPDQQSLFRDVSGLLPCWASTSLSARGRIPFDPEFFDLVVIDEASQNDIASALPLLYRAKRAVIIGDPQQLSHISGLQPGQDQQLMSRFGLLPDHLNWSYGYNSLFDLAASLVPSDRVINLRDHHRSHADIIEFSNAFYYEGRLRVATNYDKLNPPASDPPGVRWVDTRGSVIRPSSGGAVNQLEAQAVVTVLRDLILTRGFTGSVGVVTPFKVQANLIRDLASKDPALAARAAEVEFLVDTVHKFQGDERDVMIFSPVVSTGTPDSALRFLSHNGRLFNVAITRARAQLIVVGDLAACRSSKVDYLASFAEYCSNLAQRVSGRVASPAEGAPATALSSDPLPQWTAALCRALEEAGLRPLPRHRVDMHTLDLALIVGEHKLALQVDSDMYHKDWTEDLRRREALRNHRLIELGWDIRRFWVYEIRDDLVGCVDRVQQWAAVRAPAADTRPVPQPESVAGLPEPRSQGPTDISPSPDIPLAEA